MDRPWTVALLEERLVQAFREFPSEPIYSARLNAFEPTAATKGDGAGWLLRLKGFQLIAVTAILLGRESPERLALLTWARVRAGMAGESVGSFCRLQAWSRQTFDNRRRAAAKAVVDGINAHRLLSEVAAGRDEAA